MRGSWWLCVALAWLPLSAQADVLLQGDQHIGDQQLPLYEPRDPVRRERMLAYPSRFHLTQPSTITAVVFENAIELDGLIAAIEIDGVAYSGNLSGSTFTLDSPLTLSTGTHSIAPDPGCFESNSSNTPVPCSTADAGQNDISFSALRLVSPQDTTSIMFNQRRTIGDNNDSNDDYDLDLTAANAWYPDTSDGLEIVETFSLDRTRVLSEIRFYRLRDVGATDNQVRIDGALVGNFPGTEGTFLDPFILYPGVPLASGTHSLRVVSGNLGGGKDTLSWDDIVLIFGSPGGGELGAFNAVDAGQSPFVGRIGTKVASGAANSSVDIVAFNATGTAINAAFEGSVTVELLDAEDDSGAVDANGCRSSWSVIQSLGATTFAVADAGRKAFAFAYADVLKVARLRLSGGGEVACSTDAFAIRPDTLEVLVSHDDSLSPGTAEPLDNTGSGGSPIHRAGRPFTIRVLARNASGSLTANYEGPAELSVASVVEGPIPGTLGGLDWTATAGVLRTDEATYGEAGSFNLQSRDAEFAIVDADDTSASNRVISATTGVGRFTPDHFRLVSRNTPTFAAGCGGFTYIGQPFSLDMAAEALLEAVDASGARTLNYTLNAQLNKLPASAGAPTWAARRSAPPFTPVALSVDGGTHPYGSNTEPGTFSVQFGINSLLTVPRTVPEAPFNLEIGMIAGTVEDSDGVAYADPTVDPLAFGSDAPGEGLGFGTGSNRFVFGRLFVRNAYGSELLPLNVPFGAEYYQSGTNGYGSQTEDSCTPAPIVTLAGGPAASTSVSGTTGLSLGLGTVVLAAPSPTATGSVDLSLAGPAWLGVDANADGLFSEAATGQASFGVFRQQEQQIYLRETY